MAVSVKGSGGITLPNKQVLVGDSPIENDLYIEKDFIEYSTTIKNDNKIIDIYPFKSGYIVYYDNRLVQYFEKDNYQKFSIILPSFEEEIQRRNDMAGPAGTDSANGSVPYGGKGLIGHKMVMVDNIPYIISIGATSYSYNQVGAAYCIASGFLIYCYKIELNEYNNLTYSCICGECGGLDKYTPLGIDFFTPIKILSNQDTICLNYQYLQSTEERTICCCKLLDINLANQFTSFDTLYSSSIFNTDKTIILKASNVPYINDTAQFWTKHKANIIKKHGNLFYIVNQFNEIIYNIATTEQTTTTYNTDNLVSTDLLCYVNSDNENYEGYIYNNNKIFIYRLNLSTSSWVYAYSINANLLDVKLNKTYNIDGIYIYNELENKIYIYNSFSNITNNNILYSFNIPIDIISIEDIIIQKIDTVSTNLYGIYLNIINYEYLIISSHSQINNNGVLKND